MGDLSGTLCADSLFYSINSIKVLILAHFRQVPRTPNVVLKAVRIDKQQGNPKQDSAHQAHVPDAEQVGGYKYEYHVECDMRDGYKLKIK